MPRQVDEVIREQVKALREVDGLSQGDLALRVQEHGVAWNRAVVAAVETGRRKLSAVEFVVLAAVFMVSPSRLLAGDTEVEVLVGDATWTTHYVRAVVADGAAPVPVPATFTSPMRIAKHNEKWEAIDEAEARRHQFAERWGLQHAAVGLIFDLMAQRGDAEEEAALRLRKRWRAHSERRGVDALDVVAAAAHRFGRPLLAERERRLAKLAPKDATARTLQAIRAQITRALDDELADEIVGPPLRASKPGPNLMDVDDPEWLVKYLTRVENFNRKGRQ